MALGRGWWPCMGWAVRARPAVAVEYALPHLGEVGVVWQFPAEDAAVMATGFTDLAAQLGVGGRGGRRGPGGGRGGQQLEVCGAMAAMVAAPAGSGQVTRRRLGSSAESPSGLLPPGAASLTTQGAKPRYTQRPLLGTPFD